MTIVFLTGLKDVLNMKILFSFSRSPDGLCILTNSDDNLLRVFNLPPEVQQNGSTSQTDKTMVCCLVSLKGRQLPIAAILATKLCFLIVGS